MKVRTGDVVRAYFYKDKLRTAAVIGNDDYVYSTVILCPTTSALAGGPLRPRVGPGGSSGLDQLSELMPYRMQSMPPERVRDKIGRLTAAQMRELEDVLLALLGLRAACERLR